MNQQVEAPQQVDDEPQTLSLTLEQEEELEFERAFNARYGNSEEADPDDPEIPEPKIESKTVSQEEEEEPEPPAAKQTDPKDLLPDGSPIQRPAWYADLSDEAKAKFDEDARQINQLQWQYANVHGRLAPVQRENERLQRQLADAMSMQPAPADSGQRRQSQPGQPLATSQPQDLPPEFKEYAEAFPEEARAIEAMFTALSERNVQLERQVGTLVQGFNEIQQASTNRTRQEELTRLTSAHPDWMQLRETPDYVSWLSHQPPSVQALDQSPHSDDCIYLLDTYKQTRYLANLPQQPLQGQPGQVQQTRQRRELRRQPTPDPQGGGVGMPRLEAGAGLSEEDIFEQEFNRRIAAQRQQFR